MALHNIKQGKNLRIEGEAQKDIVELPIPQRVAIQPPDFRGLNPRLAVKEGDEVKVGSPLITDKVHDGLTVTSPASGKVVAINRGDKRALLEIVVETDGKQEPVVFESYGQGEIANLKAEAIKKQLVESGIWPAIRQRPFSKVAIPDDNPKSIFIQGINTEPLSADIDFILNGQEEAFQAGVDLLVKLTSGKVYLATAPGVKSKALTSSSNVEIHQFVGPHPAGNVSTHIHYIDPINKGDIVWYIGAQDVVRIGLLFLKGVLSSEKIVAVTGSCVKNRVYAKTVLGAPLSSMLQGSDLTNTRCISGSVLAGRSVGANGYLGFYDTQVSVIPEGGERELLGWLSPGVNKYTLSYTYLSSFLAPKDRALDTDENGGHRAMVLNHLYDELVPLDLMTYFLLKAVIAGEIEEAEKLGILECDEEDFALCTFACPSKTDVGAIIRKGLTTIEIEG